MMFSPAAERFFLFTQQNVITRVMIIRNTGALICFLFGHGEGKFLCLTMHIAQGLCIERTRQPIQSLTINDQPMPAGFSLNKFTEPAMLVSANTFDNHSKLRNMIDMLPVQQREVIVLNHYSGISFKEIAELMKCSITSALETMRFGLQNLGKLMIEKEVCC